MGEYKTSIEIGGSEYTDRYHDLILEFNRIFHSFQTYGTQKDLMEITWRMYDKSVAALHKTEDEWSWQERTTPPHSLPRGARMIK